MCPSRPSAPPSSEERELPALHCHVPRHPWVRRCWPCPPGCPARRSRPRAPACCARPARATARTACRPASWAARRGARSRARRAARCPPQPAPATALQRRRLPGASVRTPSTRKASSPALCGRKCVARPALALHWPCMGPRIAPSATAPSVTQTCAAQPNVLPCRAQRAAQPTRPSARWWTG